MKVVPHQRLNHPLVLQLLLLLPPQRRILPLPRLEQVISEALQCQETFRQVLLHPPARTVPDLPDLTLEHQELAQQVWPVFEILTSTTVGSERLLDHQICLQ